MPSTLIGLIVVLDVHPAQVVDCRLLALTFGTVGESKSPLTSRFAPSATLNVGASFTAVTLKVIVFGEASRFCPPLAVPPLSLTWNVKDASPAPLAFGSGVHVKLARSPEAITWPAVTSMPDNRMTPAVGSVVIVTFCNVLAGVSFGSVKPKSLAAKVNAVSSLVVTVRFVPAGASFTAVTPSVMVLGVWSVFCPPLASVPLSVTWKVKVETAAPLALAGGVHVRLAMFAAVIT